MYLQLRSTTTKIFNSAEILLCHSSDNGNTTFKSVMWRRFWSLTLAISLVLFSSDLEKFKFETQIKTFKNMADEKNWNKRSNKNYFIKCILKAVSIWSPEACKVRILLVPTTNAVSKRSHSVLCRVKTYLWSSMTQEPLSSCLIVTNYKKQVVKLKLLQTALKLPFFEKFLPPQCERVCRGSEWLNNIIYH